MSNRRNFLQYAMSVGAGLLAAPAFAEAQHESHKTSRSPMAMDMGAPPRVQTPDVPELDFTLDNGVKVFHLVAEPVKQEIFPGRTLDLWGYNGSAPGPTIQVDQGDRVRIIVDNHLPESTSMHWHGFEIPIEQDGIPHISQKPISPGGRHIYEFTLHQEGTFFYHSHNAMQEMMGLIGLFIMHPKKSASPRVDRDFGFILQEYAVRPNNSVPNSMAMEFNWLTMNGKSAPATTPVLVKRGERVRMRWVNIGMDHHPIHLHGHTFVVTGTEAGRQPESTWLRKNTVLVGVAEAVDFEFVANNPGDWMVHCHLPHHMMNNMVSSVGPMASMQHTGADISANAHEVPGFPQDAYMEMVMDEAVEKPETYGLVKGWTSSMMGMMTLVRILEPATFDTIMALKQNQPAKDKKPSGMEHKHGK